MKTIKIFDRAGSPAENKDVGQEIRLKEILPAFERGEEVTLDFESVESATQSFIHSLISDVMRKYGEGALDRIVFKSCNPNVKQMIGIVADYMQVAIQKERASSQQ